MRIAIYSRVSTDRQDTQNQLHELRNFAQTQGWEIVSEFIDTGWSGGTADRPEFQRMFQAAERKDFDLLLFWSLDRLSREGVLETLTHLNRLTEAGVAYRSFTEQYLDSCGLFKDAIISIMATLARQEKIRISERTKAGLEIARRRGVKLGRRGVEFDQKDVIKLRQKGLSGRAISRTLNVPQQTISRAIRRLQIEAA
jgi:DNA invertase Pin-like site-specific DNA recombinase